MPTRLTKPLKREIEIRGEPHTITISPEGVSIAPKGTRRRQSLSWEALMSGDAALARDLTISLDAFSVPE